jgi:uncharacterized protein YdaU (DUF1376 family)
MKWYKRDPAAALEGMIGLSGEERGYYNTLLDLLYARSPHGTVTDELVIKAAGERPQVWRRVKAMLIAKGKVRETDGKLTANRVETEVKLARNRMDNMAVWNAKKNKTNDLGAHGTDTKPQLQPDLESSLMKQQGIQPRARRDDASLELQLAQKCHLGISPDKGMDYRAPPAKKSDNVLAPIPEKQPSRPPARKQAADKEP